MSYAAQSLTGFSSAELWRSRRIYFIGALGTVIEWYDFAIYTRLSSVFAHVFFANSKNSLLIVYAVFFVSYLARPLGGLLYGFIGDSFGRKPALLLSIGMMTLCMFVTMLLPTWHMQGETVPILLIIFRIIQGLSVGGETIGALTYILESVDLKRQGLFGGATWAMGWLGGLLASIMIVSLMHFLKQPQLFAWGWRVAYLVGGIGGVIILLLRLIIPESIEFELERQRIIREKIQVDRSQLSLTNILLNYKLPIISIIALLALSGTMDGFIYAYFATYIHKYFSISLIMGWSLNIAVELSAIVFIIFSGALSDWINRRKLLMISASFFLIFSYPLLSLLSTGEWRVALFVVILLTITLVIYEGPLPAILVRLAPLQVRYTVFALGFNTAFAVFVGSSPIICALLARLSPLAPAFYFMALALCSLLALYLIGRNTKSEK